jgi:hypothetical protein
MKSIHLKFFVSFIFIWFCQPILAQTEHPSHGQGNPIIPGYFADPTVKKFGDTYYTYTQRPMVMVADLAPRRYGLRKIS